MYRQTHILTALLALFLFMGSATIACSRDNPPEGQEAFTLNTDQNNVPVGTTVTATAWTNAKDVRLVTFIWIDPKGHQDHMDFKVPDKDGYARSSFKPDEVGTWHIRAIFAEINLREREFELEVKRTPLFVIPEVPFGSVGILSGMFCALFLLKRKDYTV